MANELVVLSAQALALREKMKSKLEQVNKAAVEGLFAGLPPQIRLSGTRFKIVEGSNERVLEVNRIGLIFLLAKETFNKAYYIGKFNPEEDIKAPDCYSFDGVHPDPNAESHQHPTCQGCPRNCFGTATDGSGKPTGGKACSDIKVLAVTAGEIDKETGKLKCYQFKVPPASLTNWNKYVQELSAHACYLPEVITFVSFDPKVSFPRLVFTMAQTVPDDKIGIVMAALDDPEVAKLIEFKSVASVPKLENKPVENVSAATPENTDVLAGLGLSKPTVAEQSAAEQTKTVAISAEELAALRAAAERGNPAGLPVEPAKTRSKKGGTVTPIKVEENQLQNLGNGEAAGVNQVAAAEQPDKSQEGAGLGLGGSAEQSVDTTSEEALKGILGL